MDIDRRTVLQVSTLAAVGGFVVACGSSTTQSPPSSAESAASAAPASASAGSAVLTAASAVPVGGGVVLAEQAVVVTQPTAGDFKAFSAICTHQGCLVGPVENNEIICPCHGSLFSAADGSVLQGPATQPLAPGKVSVTGGNVVLDG